jgi:hypothetical protein
VRHPFLKTLAASPRDPDFENVILSMHGDGTNGAQSLTFLDSSANNYTVSAGGGAYQGTFSPFGDNWSNYFDGTGDYLTVPDNAAFDFGTGDFTIECWFYINADSINNSLNNVRRAGLFSTMAASGVRTNMYRLVIDGSTSATGTGIVFTNWQSDTAYIVSATTTVSKNAWHHVAVARSGTTTKLFLDGSEIGSGTLGNQTVNSSSDVKIGRTHYSQEEELFIGYISNVRVLKGTALYTGSYSVPTIPLTAITNTSLLTCNSNRFRDDSTNNFTVTVNGDGYVRRFSPFSRPAAYSASAIGGSGLIEGGLAGSFSLAAGLSAFSMAASDFSFEAWVYKLGNPDGDDASIFSRNSGTGTPSEASYLFILGPTNSEVYSGSSAYSIASPNPVVRQWSHVAWARTGGTFSSYLNGARIGTIGTLGTSSLNVLSTAGLLIGADAVNGFQLSGYLSGVRIIKGSGGYNATSSTITVPTAPPTAVTNTQLLLNFTNAGIVDSAAMGNVITNNDAKLNTTTKKYGTGSIQFDGTGDNIEVYETVDQLLRTGAFTIEMWVYRNAAGVAHSLIAKGGTSTGWLVSINASNVVVFTYGTSTITSITTIGATTWTHIAVVREGTGTNQTKIYINGTNSGTGTVATDFTQTNVMFIGCNRVGQAFLNGYLDDIRITKGVARYTANFTAPTAAFPDL